MRETEMEDLIAKYPDEFFPPPPRLTFDRRQTRYPLVPGQTAGIIDLLFKADSGESILLELKAGTATVRAADQLIRYAALMRAAGEEKVVLWLVATYVPEQIVATLAQFGIRTAAIPETEYRRVAAVYGYVIKSDRRRRPPRKKPEHMEDLDVVLRLPRTSQEVRFRIYASRDSDTPTEVFLENWAFAWSVTSQRDRKYRPKDLLRLWVDAWDAKRSKWVTGFCVGADPLGGGGRPRHGIVIEVREVGRPPRRVFVRMEHIKDARSDAVPPEPGEAEGDAEYAE